MRRNTSMVYLMPMGKSFRSHEIMRCFIDKVVAQDFFVDFGYRRRMISQNPEVSSWLPSYSDTMEAHVDAFISGDLNRLHMFSYSIEREGALGGFDFSFFFESEVCRVHINLTHMAFIWQEEVRQLAFMRWLKLFLAVYDIWRPVYGYCEPLDIEWPEPTREDIDLARLPCLYEINFFGPAIVAQLGREHVLNTPAWSVQPLTDGGALLVPEFYFRRPDPLGGHNPGLWERAARHLGFPVLVPGNQVG